MIKDSSWGKIKKYHKYKDICDMGSLECKCALAGAVIICVLMWIMENFMDITNINNVLEVFTKDIAMALIGFLGFTVSGLAILTGVITKKEVGRISAANKVSRLEKILLSFYLLGVVIGFTIIGHIILFIFSSSNLPYNIYVIAGITFIFSYLDIFIIFYSVKLVGNCLDLFFIVNEENENEANERADNIVINFKSIYNSYRLTALETVCLKKMTEKDLDEYREIIREQIEKNGVFVDDLEKLFNEHFSIGIN